MVKKKVTILANRAQKITILANFSGHSQIVKKPLVNNRLFSKDSNCRQSDVDEFFRSKPTLRMPDVGNILESSVRMRKRRIHVLKRSHLEHVTYELQRLHEGPQKINAFQTAPLLYCIQAISGDDAQTSGL